MTIEVLTAAKAIPDNTTPTGHKFEIVNVDGTSMFRIKRAKGDTGAMPEELLGNYTSMSRAQTILTRFLIKFWAEVPPKVKKVA